MMLKMLMTIILIVIIIAVLPIMIRIITVLHQRYQHRNHHHQYYCRLLRTIVRVTMIQRSRHVKRNTERSDTFVAILNPHCMEGEEGEGGGEGPLPRGREGGGSLCPSPLPHSRRPSSQQSTLRYYYLFFLSSCLVCSNLARDHRHIQHPRNSSGNPARISKLERFTLRGAFQPFCFLGRRGRGINLPLHLPFQETAHARSFAPFCQTGH